MLNKINGFTLIEVLAATFLLTVGVGATLIAVNQTSAFTQVTSSRLTAIYLAQEGIEIVKNIRDTNFLKINKGIAGVTWYGDLCLTSPCNWKADYTTTSFINDCASPTAHNCDTYDGDKLNFDVSGFYKYSAAGQQSLFKRKITISALEDLDTPPDGIPDKMKVQTLVSWEERGRSHEVTVQEIFYKWW